MHQARTVLLMDFLVLSAASCPSSEMLQLSWSVSPPPRGCSNGPDSFMPHICTIRAPERWARGPVATKPLPLTGNISTTLLPTSQKSSTMFSQIWLACFSQLYYPQKLKQLLFALGGGLSEFSVRCHGLIFWECVWMLRLQTYNTQLYKYLLLSRLLLVSVHKVTCLNAWGVIQIVRKRRIKQRGKLQPSEMSITFSP